MASGWFQRMWRRKERAVQPARPRSRWRFVPVVEGLEQRLTPSISKVQDLGVASSYYAADTTHLKITIPAAGVAAGHTIIGEFAMDPHGGPVTVADTAGNVHHIDADVTTDNPNGEDDY